MRHKNKVKQLGRKTKHRKAMIRNLAINLIKYERVTTTLVKAKVLRSYIEKLITKAKYFNLYKKKAEEVGVDTSDGKRYIAMAVHKARLLGKKLGSRKIVYKLLHNISLRYMKRNGGYTRIYKLAKWRVGDNAPLSIIEFVEEKLEANVKEASDKEVLNEKEKKE